jgi:oligosaccharide reducing-end xylanase
VWALLALAAGCTSTVDSLGYNDQGGIVLHPMTGPPAYPNAFRDLLGKSDPDIATKIATAFAQLFHGDAGTQAIYFTVGTDQADVQDVFHGDVRTEGMGLGMIICVELDKRDEFDRLWRYAKATLAVADGAAKGYFNSQCQVPGSNDWMACLDPFGLQQFVMALLLANDRWGGVAATIDYASDVKALLTVMRHKQDKNGGVVNGVTDTFDAVAQLPFDVPNTSAAGVSRPSIVLPGYYALWAQATADPFWTAAAASGRAYWQRAAHPTTGFMPVRARFDGMPVTGGEMFGPQSYRAELAAALDKIWTGGGAAGTWEVDDSNRLLGFFTGVGIDQYGSTYSLDGTTILEGTHDPALVAMNGAAASIATGTERTAFVSAVWDLPTPTGPVRYYAGLMDLLSLLILGGQLRVY